MKTIQVCSTCGSPRVLLDAYVNINDEEDVRIYDNAVCEDCDADGCNIAVWRCFVAAKQGDEVDIPEELLK